MNRRPLPSRALLALLVPAWLASANCSETVDILLPLYSYPSWYAPSTYLWDDVAAAASQVPITAIVNPDNGPGGAPPNSDYDVGLTLLRDSGVTLVGYVYTSYGARDLAAVKADVDLYAGSWAVNGIFVDEVSSGAADLTYYQPLYDYIRAKPGLDRVVVNPGTHVDEGYVSAPASDVAVIFENGSGWSSYAPDPYVASYSDERFAALGYGITDVPTMQHFVDLAVQRNVGYVFVTDDTLPNPWDSLPPYWTDEVSYIAAHYPAP
ncbi:MAG: spherulation-specific family 4 protein [Deltaproteobacteria bacterium]|nr:spherulation-specific family 4 protein [Deltaproteobacteria bacterium]